MVKTRSDRGRSLALALCCIAVLSVSCSSTSSEASDTTQAASDTPAAAVTVRKDAKNLTADEKQELVEAFHTLKATPSEERPGSNLYDDFVHTHLEALSCARRWENAGAAHNSPTFLPWHREWLMEFEEALRKAADNPDLSLPYWDWTDAESTDAVFSNDLLGPNGDALADYAVTEGPFAKDRWTVNVTDPIEVQQALLSSNNVVAQPAWLVRNFGALMGTTQPLPTAQDVSEALSVGTYDDAPWSAQSSAAVSFRCNLEGFRDAEPPQCVATPDNADGYFINGQRQGAPVALHNGVHLYVGGRWEGPGGALAGGTMNYHTSPNDPVFFLHHANVDRIWAAWEQDHPDSAEYLPQGEGADGWNGEDTMWPWHDRPINSLQDTQQNGYRYDSLPTP